MTNLTIKPARKIKGEINIPGDKSISHRSVMLGSIADGETVVNNFLNSADCLATAECFRKMGIHISEKDSQLIIKGRGLNGLERPSVDLYVGNSGTTIRIISGILAGQVFASKISGDESIQKRPMKRIVEPLTRMGAKIEGRGDERTRERKDEGRGEVYPPLEIGGGKLHGIVYKLPMASAQVKSCVLLAGLYAQGTTTVIEPAVSRDHTERMLRYLGADLTVFKNEITLRGGKSFEGREINVPGDISSAAFFMAVGILVPEADLFIRNVGVNPTRTGIIEVLHLMGAPIEVQDEEIISGEPRANIKVRRPMSYVLCQGIDISGDMIPKVIDELPIIAVIATQANGTTVISNATELRVKESDRIAAISAELKKMGAKIEEKEDGMVIHGPTKLKGAQVKSYGDHRVAMSLAVAGLIAEGETVIEGTDCIETSFPGFEKLLRSIL